MKKLTAFISILLISTPLWAKGVSKTIEYKHGKTKCEGYLAYDDSLKGRRPGVIVVHEWTGLGDYAKMRADKLAEMGYVAFAIDMYGKDVRAKDHKEAAQLSGIYRKDRKLMRQRAQAGLKILQQNKNVDAERIAAIGYCFGGTTVLEMARNGENLKGVASFHGGLDSPSPAGPGEIKAKIIVFHGADDAWTEPSVPKFEEEMKKAGADWQITKYGGAVHSFTVKEAGDDPSSGKAYNATADKRSWVALKDFLKEIFK